VIRTLPQPPPPAVRLRRHQRQALASPGQKLKWRIEAWGVRLLLALLRGRQHPNVQRTIHRAVALAQPLLADRLATANANLERVYGDALTNTSRQRLARQSLESFFLSCLESIIAPVDPSLIVVEGEGMEALLQPQAGQGAIVASLHLGCWDLALRWLSEQRNDLAVIYRPAHNPDADHLLNAARSANSHCRWISQFDRRAMLTCLLRGDCLVVMTDLYGGRNPVTTDVLGLETHMAAGPLSLCQRTGAPLFPVAHVRERDGRFRVIIGAPLQPQPGAEGLMRLAEALNRWQEPWIRAYPEQYYWINRRWRAGDSSGRRLRELPPPGRD
jgi:lauroyl/myristoyl acyltransferase